MALFLIVLYHRYDTGFNLIGLDGSKIEHLFYMLYDHILELDIVFYLLVVLLSLLLIPL